MSELLDLSPGAVFADQFRVVRPLARGGMGAVYVVEQMGTARERALKLMHPQIASDAKSIERFEREARVASKIDSDHVVEVIGAGVDQKTSTPWLCMELLLGETLADRCEKRGRLSREETLEVVKQLGHALTAAHRAGIVHRDLKPENLFLATARREGVPFTLKVLDFGVAALVADAQGAKTTQGVGSPMWMAPEQTNVGRVTTATDVWALGLIAFYVLTGKVYWKSPSIEGSSLTALLVEMMVEEMPLASVRATELLAGGLLPTGFDAWFARATDRDPSKRFADASAALPGLIAVLEGTATIAATALAQTAIAPTRPMSAAPRVESPPASNGWKWGVGVVAVVGVCAVAWIAMSSGGQPATTLVAEAPAVPVASTVPIATPPTTTVADVEEESEGEGEDDESEDEEDEDESEDDDSDDSDDSDESDESEGDDDSDGEAAAEDDTTPVPAPAPGPRSASHRVAAPSASALAARRMLIDACWNDNFEGEPTPPPVRWTFDFMLDASGRASNVRITGPTGDTFAGFRRCVVTRVGQYNPSDGTTHVVLTLPS